MKYNYKVHNLEDGTCCRWIKFDIDEGHNVSSIEFLGGCQGNQKAISTLLQGVKAESIIDKLQHITCGTKRDSCSSELCKGLKEAISLVDGKSNEKEIQN